MPNKIGLVIHGGASEETPLIRDHAKEMQENMAEILQTAYQILKKGGHAIDVVQAAVVMLEDDPLFNAGRGSALNCEGEVEMDASIMNGKNLYAGAVALVKSVKNPVVLAREVMEKTKHVFLSSYGALDFAKTSNIKLEPESYFVTDYQRQEFEKVAKHETLQKIMQKKIKGTVGAVALDKRGNLAAATSTGGTANCLAGRIGDSCVIGSGCYANNKTCAVSGTGEGEVLIVNVIAHTISMLVELKKMPIQKACDYVILKRARPRKGEIGVISIDPKANIGISFNTETMKRGWITSDKELQVKIYRK